MLLVVVVGAAAAAAVASAEVVKPVRGTSVLGFAVVVVVVAVAVLVVMMVAVGFVATVFVLAVSALPAFPTDPGCMLLFSLLSPTHNGCASCFSEAVVGMSHAVEASV